MIYIYNYHNELSILDGLILKGTYIVIPEKCKDEILDQLYEGHFGTDHTKMHVHKRFCIGLKLTKI